MDGKMGFLEGRVPQVARFQPIQAHAPKPPFLLPVNGLCGIRQIQMDVASGPETGDDLARQTDPGAAEAESTEIHAMRFLSRSREDNLEVVKLHHGISGLAWMCAGLLWSCAGARAQSSSQVLAWNNLGMHCMDDDFSIFAILPPYNTVLAQVVTGTNGTAYRRDGTGIYVNYQAVLDARNSINATSVGKNNFWDFSLQMLGAALPPDEGLSLSGASPGAAMPGAGNSRKPMHYESAPDWFVAWGVPITPYDDNLQLNPYPLMHVAATGAVPAAATDIVLPVSVEMNCRACHSSGSGPAARPAADWEWNTVPTRDYRLNILQLHDEERFADMAAAYTNVLAAKGYNARGLYATVIEDGKPLLCASCHLSEAIPDSGEPGVPPLTEAVHTLHAGVNDPDTGVALGVTSNRSACYRCHPGGETRCLRGAMGHAVATNGTLAMQCQNCHGTMAMVGSTNRTGWLDEPNCQACHTGDAVTNSGQIRYDNAYSAPGVLRTPVNRRFATTSNAPSADHSLFRFSKGHGGLYCSACHGSTHAEFPSAFRNDNVASMQRQGHVGQLSECSACHGTTPSTATNGPHGMHSLGWVSGHKNPGRTAANCQQCHGTNYHGSVLSRSFKNQTQQGVYFWRGRRIGCYECHNGPVETGQSPPAAPTATNVAATTTVNRAVAFTLPGSTSARRIVAQPEYGMVGLAGTTATYTPALGYTGTETFAFCADSGVRESNLATATVTVADSGPCAFALDTNLEFFDERGHVDSVGVATGTGCLWSATSDTLWLGILSGASGTGPGTVWYSIARNTNGAARTGFLRIAGKTVTVIQDPAPADANGDGLPDAWQMLYFDSVSSANARPDADPDGDGVPNRDEYPAATDPMNDVSALRILTFTPWSLTQTYELTYPTLLSHYYQAQRTTNLQTGRWKGFTNATFGTGATVPFAGPMPSNESVEFIRILHAN